MTQQIKLPHLTEEDALGRIISWLKSPPRDMDSVSFPNYGHDLYIPNVIFRCLKEVKDEDRALHSEGMRSYGMDTNQSGSSVFYDAAWILCRSGVLRPDPPNKHANGEDVGRGFAVTPYGRQWIKQLSGYECIPSEYGRFANLLAGHASRFGGGYHGRSQEAVNCYRAHTYLACCAMCGAAAESILLALAIAKKGDEEEVLREYRSANGRSKVEKFLVGQKSGRIQQDFINFMSLLKYWRDDAAHGAHSIIDEDEAFTSLILLLRFAQFADNGWDELTS